MLDAYWAWVEILDPAPGSKLADAVTYAQNQKRYLNAFLEHGEVDISNNPAENAIRPFVIGRKNLADGYLFFVVNVTPPTTRPYDGMIFQLGIG